MKFTIVTAVLVLIFFSFFQGRHKQGDDHEALLVHWITSGDAAIEMKCSIPELCKGLNDKNDDIAFTAQFILLGLNAPITDDLKRVVLKRLKAQRRDDGLYAFSRKFSAESDTTAAVKIVYKILNQPDYLGNFEEYECRDKTTGQMLYGTFVADGLACDGQGFNTGRKGRDVYKDFAPTVIASVLRVADILVEEKRAMINATFPHWKKASYYNPVLSSFFWLQALNYDYPEKKAQICGYLSSSVFENQSELEKAVIAYNGIKHCQFKSDNMFVSFVKAKIDSDEEFEQSPLWYFNHYREKDNNLIGYDKGLIARALSLAVYNHKGG